jgi:hypothetical protein
VWWVGESRVATGAPKEVTCALTDGVAAGDAGDYVIVSKSAGADPVDGDVGGDRRMYSVQHVLYKEQIRHLKSAGKWPFPDVATAAVNPRAATVGRPVRGGRGVPGEMPPSSDSDAGTGDDASDASASGDDDDDSDSDGEGGGSGAGVEEGVEGRAGAASGGHRDDDASSTAAAESVSGRILREIPSAFCGGAWSCGLVCCVDRLRSRSGVDG